MGSWILSKRMGYMFYSPDPGEQVRVPYGKTYKIGTVIDVTFPPSRRARVLFPDTGQHVSIHMRVLQPITGVTMDRAAKLGPHVGYDVAANPDRILELRSVATTNTSKIIEGLNVDPHTARLVLSVYDRLSEEAQEKFNLLDIFSMCYTASYIADVNGR